MRWCTYFYSASLSRLTSSRNVVVCALGSGRLYRKVNTKARFFVSS